MEIIEGAQAINKAIVSIASRGAKLDTSIHQAGVSALAHASEHGDPSLLSKLVQAMPKGGRKLALVEWILAHGQVRKLDPKAPADAPAIKEGMLFKLDRTRELDLPGAIATSWVEFKKEADVLTAFDAHAAVKALMARLTKAGERGLEVQGRAEALAEAEALVAALRGE